MIAGMRCLGQCFVPSDNMGITPMQEQLLLQAGFLIQGQETFSTNYSRSTPDHPVMRENDALQEALMTPSLANQGLFVVTLANLGLTQRLALCSERRTLLLHGNQFHFLRFVSAEP